MILYPAIDLKGGQCVRVLRGDLNQATVFNDDPAAQARAWADAGFSWLHVIDLNGSVEGRAVNGAAVEAILQAVDLPVQLGGGVRTEADADRWLEAGVRRVILGTAAVRDPELVKRLAARHPERIAVSVDVRGGKVAVQGWTETSELDAISVARRFEDAGIAALIVTDIDRDGALQGFDVEVFGRVADAVALPVIAAGGLAGAQDIARVRARGVAGAVLGRALYTGDIRPQDALKAAA